MNLLEALDDPNLFQPWIKDSSSYVAWRTFLAALFGLPMTDEQKEIFQECTGREHPPTEQAKQAWMIVGRRGGKSFNMALLAVFSAAFRDYRQYLAPGERATIMVIAADRKQARTIMRYVSGLLENIPLLATMVTRKLEESVELDNRSTIEVATANFRTVRGYTIPLAIGDEIAFWRSEDSANPDREVIAALKPAMLTIPGSMMVCASSPYSRRGVLWEAREKHFGRDGNVLVWQAPTRTMNPTVPQEEIDAAYEADPASASAEYGANFRSDLQSFVDRETLMHCVEVDVHERPYDRRWRYIGFVDPSGGSQDSYTMGIAHKEGLSVVLDAVREIKPPFSPENVTEEFCSLLSSYRITKVYGDRYAGEWPREQFRKRGITYLISEKSRSNLYRDVLPRINSGLCSLLDHPKMIAQFTSLERKTGLRGDTIDHPPGAHDDIANAAAGALEHAAVLDGKERDPLRAKPKQAILSDPLAAYRTRRTA
ncbi:terminase [Pseudorhizobium endolithicum]|uniref:Terminase n=1 Tax=Pseudorhizobium endolithicum TaxID=1191678 RepID=A0ABN7JV17_9HYPH|nr:terminase large subunit [Pseudorhizobium endolithicum]CAD7044715.1 terminase [Pseudorhizobium endolithicum]